MKKMVTLCTLMIITNLITRAQVLDNYIIWQDERSIEQHEIRKESMVSQNRITKKKNHELNTRSKKQKLDSIIYRQWDKMENDWIDTLISEFVYNDDQRLNYTKVFKWNGINADKERVKKQVYGYNSKGLVTQMNRLRWKESTSKWDTTIKYIYSYDEHDNREQEQLQLLNRTKNEWYDIEITKFTFDVNNNTITEDTKVWNPADSTWIDYFKFEYFYNQKNKLTKEIEYGDYGNDNWRQSAKEEYYYDNESYLVREESSYRDMDLMQWVPSKRLVHSYSQHHELLKTHRDFWNSNTQTYTPNYKVDYSSDVKYSYIDLVLPINEWIVNPRTFNFKLTESKEYKWNIGPQQWEQYRNYEMFYSDLNTDAVDDYEERELKIYPNPFTKELVINYLNINQPIIFELYQLDGQKIITKNTTTNNILQLDNLSSGIYLYKIFINGDIHNGSVLKQ